MSADNWALCPRCEERRREADTERATLAANAYGKVSEHEYHRLRDEAKRAGEVAPERTLREDYDIGTDEHGTFAVDYRSHCDCGYSFDYKLEITDEQIDQINAARAPDLVTVAARKLVGRRGRSQRG